MLLFLCAFFTQCSGRVFDKFDNAECDSIAWELSYLMNDYYIIGKEQSFIRLDSALLIIESIDGKCEKYNTVNSLRKLSILSIKQEYSQAIKYAEQLNDTIIAPIYKVVIINRFKAMIAQKEEDIDAKNQYIRKIIDVLQTQLPPNEIDSMLHLCDIDSIMQYPKYIYLTQYYYYRVQLEGFDKIISELNSVVKDCEQDVLWILKPEKDSDFMVFNGI